MTSEAVPSVELRDGLQHLRDRATAGERYVYKLKPEQAAAVLAERTALRDALGNAMSECGCSIAERNSGHRVGCWVPDASEVLGQWP